MPETKKCTRCHIVKPYDGFYHNRLSVDHYYTHQCKQCFTAYNNANIVHRRKYARDYTKARRRRDITFKIAQYTRNKLNRILKDNKHNHTFDLIGCTPAELRQHIESQFTDGMNWQNITIDHILPITFFNLTDDIQVRQLFNYHNLQPMSKLDNIKKSGGLAHILPIGILD